MLEDALPEEQGDGIDVEGQAQVAHISDELRIADHHAEAHRRQRKELREGAQKDHVLPLERVPEEGVRIEIVVGLVDDDDGAGLLRPVDHLPELLLRVDVPDRVVRVEEHHDAGIVRDRREDLPDVDGHVRLVGHRHVLQAQQAAVDPVHLEGRGDGHDLLPLLAEGLEEIADRLVRAVGGEDVLRLRADEVRVFFREAVRFRIDGQEFRSDLREHAVHERLRQALRVLVHIVAEIVIAALSGENTGKAGDIFVYIIIHLQFLHPFTRDDPDPPSSPPSSGRPVSPPEEAACSPRRGS